MKTDISIGSYWRYDPSIYAVVSGFKETRGNINAVYYILFGAGYKGSNGAKSLYGFTNCFSKACTKLAKKVILENQP